MDLGLLDKRALVVAASQGLGAATARRFSLEGATVTVCSRDSSRIEAAAHQIQQESGRPVFPLTADVSDPEAVSTLVRQAAEAMNGLDILVTNAGGPPAGSFGTITVEAWEQAARLTVLSTVGLIKAALPYLHQSQSPAVLTITSYAAKQPIANLVLSNSLRAAVIGLTKSLANELGPDGIRVNSILPGWTRTERVDEIMAARASANGTSVEAEIAAQTASLPLRRMARPEEFANVAVFLCSPAASYVHGAMIPVDGGAIQASL